jgi:hypothetical protein
MGLKELMKILLQAGDIAVRGCLPWRHVRKSGKTGTVI